MVPFLGEQVAVFDLENLVLHGQQLIASLRRELDLQRRSGRPQLLVDRCALHYVVTYPGQACVSLVVPLGHPQVVHEGRPEQTVMVPEKHWQLMHGYARVAPGRDLSQVRYVGDARVVGGAQFGV